MPRIAFINKMDRIGADFERSVETMIDRLGANAVPVQLPIGSESEFRGIIDLVGMKAIVYKDELGKDFDVIDIPAEHADRAAVAREHLLEEVSHFDDGLVELILEEADIPVDRLKEAIRKATLEIALTPVFCGSAFKNKGVQPLLDAVLDYLPSPLDVPPVEGTLVVKGGDDGEAAVRHADDSEPFAALAFKIMADPFVGKLTYFRVYSGKLAAGSRVLNVTSGKTERVGRILMMHANDREDVQEVYSGDIAAGVGIKQIVTGDTLAAPDAPIKLENIDFPEPVIKVAVEPRTKSDQEKMSVALGRLAEEDPTFQVQTNEETGQTEISGMGELHLEILVDRMKREFHVEANVGRPQVSYRETVRGVAQKVEGKFIRQTGGSGQYGVVYINMEPAPGEGFARRGEGLRGGHGHRRQGRLPDGRRPRHARRRQVPRHRLLGDRVQGRRLARLQGGRAPRQAGPAGAHLQGRGRDARGVHGRRDRRPPAPPRSAGRHGAARQRPGHQRPRSAERDVRLRDRPAVQHARARDLDDAVRDVRGSAPEYRREDRRAPLG